MQKVTIITPEQTNKTFKSVCVQTDIQCANVNNNNNNSHKMSLQTNDDPISLQLSKPISPSDSRKAEQQLDIDQGLAREAIRLNNIDNIIKYEELDQDYL